MFVNLDQLIRAIQEELGVSVDGNAVLETWIAIYNRICQNRSATPAFERKDGRSERERFGQSYLRRKLALGP